MRLPPASGQALEVLVEDGDNAPLEQPRVVLLADRPTLLFSVSESQRNRPLYLYFGGGLARAPRYDLAEVQVDDAWAATAGNASSLGRVESNPDFAPAPSAASLVRPGNPVVGSAFRSRRALTFAGGVGPWRVPLDVQDAALLRPDSGDARVVDAEGRPWPWREATRSVEQDVALTQLPRKGTTSVFSVALHAARPVPQRAHQLRHRGLLLRGRGPRPERLQLLGWGRLHPLRQLR